MSGLPRGAVGVIGDGSNQGLVVGVDTKNSRLQVMSEVMHSQVDRQELLVEGTIIALSGAQLL